MPREVFSVSETPCRTSAPRFFSRDDTLSLILIENRSPRTEQNSKLLGHAPHTPGADGENSISGACFAQNIFDAALQRARVNHALVTGGADRLREKFPGNTFRGRFAGGINIRQHQNVGQVEREAEVVPQISCSRVTVWLKEYQQALVAAASRRFERGANFRGMVAVIVDQRNTGKLAFDFEPAADARKMF